MVVRPRPLAEGMRESSCVGVKISPSLGHSRLQALGRGFIVVRSCPCHRTVSVGLRRILARAARDQLAEAQREESGGAGDRGGGDGRWPSRGRRGALCGWPSLDGHEDLRAAGKWWTDGR